MVGFCKQFNFKHITMDEENKVEPAPVEDAPVEAPAEPQVEEEVAE